MNKICYNKTGDNNEQNTYKNDKFLPKIPI